MFSSQQGGREEQAMGNQEALVDGRTDHRELPHRATDRAFLGGCGLPHRGLGPPHFLQLSVCSANGTKGSYDLD